MRTVNILTTHFLPEITACSNRVKVFAEALSSDYTVNVICLAEPGACAARKNVQIAHNINVYYLSQRKFNKRNFLVRSFFELYYSFKLCIKARYFEADCTIVTVPYIFLLPCAAFLVKGKSILDIRDLVWEYLPRNSFVQRKIQSLLKGVCLRSIAKFNLAMTANHVQRSTLMSVLPSVPITTMPNGISLDRYAVLASMELHRPAEARVVYVGNIGIAQTLEVLLVAAKDLPSINFDIIGQGADESSLKDYITRNGLRNVTLHGPLQWAQIVPFYQTCTLLYASLSLDYVTAIPSKLYEYLATGHPILFNGEGAAADFLESMENTYILRSGSPDALKNLIEDIVYVNLPRSSANRNAMRKSYIRELNSARLIKFIAKLQG